jgi:hypothetical protein
LLAHGLHDGAADREQQCKKHRKQDVSHDQIDIADLLHERLLKFLLRLRLRLVGRIGEMPIDLLRYLRRLRGILHDDDVPAHRALREAARFVEIFVIEEHGIFARAIGRIFIEPDDGEVPIGIAVRRLHPDRRMQRNVIAAAWAFFDGNTVNTLGAGFSQVVFHLTVTASLLVTGVFVACTIGMLGGLLPAVRAARQPIATALRGS